MALLSILSSEILTDSLNRGPFLTTARSPRLMSRDGEVGGRWAARGSLSVGSCAFEKPVVAFGVGSSG